MRKWKAWKSSRNVNSMRDHDLDIIEKMYDAKMLLDIHGYFGDSAVKPNHRFTSLKEWLIVNEELEIRIDRKA